MDKREFDARADAARLRGATRRAARAVEVDGLSAAEAARRCGLLGPASVSRALARVRALRWCECCRRFYAA